MKRALGISGGHLLALLGFMFLAGSSAWAQRIAFVIATGPTGGTYFPVGEAIATIISHPPGVYHCEKPGVCGPTGLIASVRTSPGAVSNVLAVNAHTVDAAVAQADVIADAVAGRGAFRSAGKQTHVGVLANLFPEELHLIVRTAAHIKTIAGLKGKRVSVGPSTSGTVVTAHAVLTAFRVGRIRTSNDPSDLAAEKLEKGELDAMFFVGGAPVPLVRELLTSGKAVLLPIDGPPRARLLKQNHALTPAAIPAGLYPKTGELETLGVRAMFIVNDSVPESSVYAIAKSLFNGVNRAVLTGSHRSAQFIRIETAAHDLPAPLHPGALRFYKEAGKLPKPPDKSGKS